MAITLQFHGSVLQPDMLTFLRPEMKFKNILRTEKYFCFDPKLRESSFNLGACVGNFITRRPRAHTSLRANTNRGNGTL